MGFWAVFFSAVLLHLVSGAGQAQITDRDYGPIVASNPNTVTVKGGKGRHVLVPTRVCDWCKKGKRVVVTFERDGKASLSADPESVLTPDVPAIVLRRGGVQR